MRVHYEPIWTFDTQSLRIVFDVSEEPDLDLSWDDDGSTREGLESGRYVAFVARVRAIHKPTGAELGVDYLGCCIYESAESFWRSHIENKGGDYFADMVRSVCREARKSLADLRSIPVRQAA